MGALAVRTFSHVFKNYRTSSGGVRHGAGKCGTLGLAVTDPTNADLFGCCDLSGHPSCGLTHIRSECPCTVLSRRVALQAYIDHLLPSHVEDHCSSPLARGVTGYPRAAPSPLPLNGRVNCPSHHQPDDDRNGTHKTT